MTREALAITPSYPINGVGPYQYKNPYTQGALRAFVELEERLIPLEPSEYLTDPLSSNTLGNIVLTGPSATAYDGGTLYILRQTDIEQGFAGQSARENGLAAQLDWMTEAIQDTAREVRRSLRSTAPINPFPIKSGRILTANADGDGFTFGPTVEDLNQATKRPTTAETIASLSTLTTAVDGKSIYVYLGSNGEPETFTYKKAGVRDAEGELVTADGAFVVDAVGMGEGHFVSKRTEYADFAEFNADVRSFEAGGSFRVSYGGASLQAVASGGTFTNAGGQAFVVASGPAFESRSVSSLTELAKYPSGTSAKIAGRKYVSSAATLSTSAGIDLGVAGVSPYGGFWHSEHFGLSANTAETAYGKFVEMMAASVEAVRFNFPKGELHIDNSAGPASFQSGVRYVGSRGLKFISNTNNQRLFLTQSKKNFSLRYIYADISEESGGEDTYIGGGYMRFENSEDFELRNVGVGKSFGTGIKFSVCSNFTAKSLKNNYNGFFGCELEGCTAYHLDGVRGEYNGKYSADKSYKPLPTGWTGTHGGRGLNIAGGGAGLQDQEDAVVENVRCIGNSEYGFRAYAAGGDDDGTANFTIRNMLCQDNGHPAGTYGTVTLADAKGVDFLINSGIVFRSNNIKWTNLVVRRSLNYGAAISIDGNNLEQNATRVFFTGAAKYNIAACAIFRGDGFVSRGLHSEGALCHWSFGTQLPSNVTAEDDVCTDVIKAFNNLPGAGRNKFLNGRYKRRTSGNTSSQVGVTLSDVYSEFNGAVFDGFYHGFTMGANPNALVTNCRTINTDAAGRGFHGQNVTDQSNLEVENNSFDTAFPGIFATFSANRRGSLSRRRAVFNVNPASGVSNAGSNMDWNFGDYIENSNPVADAYNMIKVGSFCTTAGTPGTWTDVFASTVSPAT